MFRKKANKARFAKQLPETLSWTNPEDRMFILDRMNAILPDGGTVARFSYNIGISKYTYYTWRERYPEFKEASDLCMTGQQAYHEDRLEEEITSGSKGAATRLAMMKSRYREDYGEKQEIEITNSLDTLTPEQLEDRIKEKLKLIHGRAKPVGRLESNDSGGTERVPD